MNTNRKKKHTDHKWGWKNWYTRTTWDSRDL